MIYVETHGTWREMGRQYGEALRPVLRRTIEYFAPWLLADTARAARTAGALRKTIEPKFPEVIDELAGMAEGSGISVDALGNAYITGGTTSTDFPTKNPLQPSLEGGGDAFVTKLSFELGSMAVERGAFQPDRTTPILQLDPLMPQSAADHLTVRFTLHHAAQVTLELYAVDGTLVAVAIADRSFEAGEQTAIVATEALQPGSYLL